jgi:hypothetical protein
MFVFNCCIKQDEQLKYPINQEVKAQSKNGRKNKKNQPSTEAENIEKLEQEQKYDIFKPVACSICNAEVGVYDETTELYYFFNILASHS